jgi:hypothetical protein
MARATMPAGSRMANRLREEEARMRAEFAAEVARSDIESG